MSNLTILGDTSGSVVLQAPAVAGSTTITMPAATGTMMVSGNMPTFLAYQSSVQSVANASVVKINFDTKTFDTNNNFNTSTGRFTPTIAGYYQINLSISLQTISSVMGLLYKTGSHYLTFVTVGIAGISNTVGTTSCVIYMNGSTDYLEGYVYQGTGGSLNSNNDSRFMQFSGCLVRAA